MRNWWRFCAGPFFFLFFSSFFSSFEADDVCNTETHSKRRSKKGPGDCRLRTIRYTLIHARLLDGTMKKIKSFKRKIFSPFIFFFLSYFFSSFILHTHTNTYSPPLVVNNYRLVCACACVNCLIWVDRKSLRWLCGFSERKPINNWPVRSSVDRRLG